MSPGGGSGSVRPRVARGGVTRCSISTRSRIRTTDPRVASARISNIHPVQEHAGPGRTLVLDQADRHPTFLVRELHPGRVPRAGPEMAHLRQVEHVEAAVPVQGRLFEGGPTLGPGTLHLPPVGVRHPGDDPQAVLGIHGEIRHGAPRTSHRSLTGPPRKPLQLARDRQQMGVVETPMLDVRTRLPRCRGTSSGEGSGRARRSRPLPGTRPSPWRTAPPGFNPGPPGP